MGFALHTLNHRYTWPRPSGRLAPFDLVPEQIKHKCIINADADLRKWLVKSNGPNING